MIKLTKGTGSTKDTLARLCFLLTWREGRTPALTRRGGRAGVGEMAVSIGHPAPHIKGEIHSRPSTLRDRPSTVKSCRVQRARLGMACQGAGCVLSCVLWHCPAVKLGALQIGGSPWPRSNASQMSVHRGAACSKCKFQFLRARRGQGLLMPLVRADLSHPVAGGFRALVKFGGSGRE